MTAEQFAYWLQGYAEVTGEAPTAEQWQVIRDHLQTVFMKVTPARFPGATPFRPSPDGSAAYPPDFGARTVC